MHTTYLLIHIPKVSMIALNLAQGVVTLDSSVLAVDFCGQEEGRKLTALKLWTLVQKHHVRVAHIRCNSLLIKHLAHVCC